MVLTVGRKCREKCLCPNVRYLRFPLCNKKKKRRWSGSLSGRANFSIKNVTSFLHLPSESDFSEICMTASKIEGFFFKPKATSKNISAIVHLCVPVNAFKFTGRRHKHWSKFQSGAYGSWGNAAFEHAVNTHKHNICYLAQHILIPFIRILFPFFPKLWLNISQVIFRCSWWITHYLLWE